MKKNIEDIEIGDYLIGTDGNPVKVTNVYESHKPKRMYEIIMGNEDLYKSSGNHLWYCETDTDKKEKEYYKHLGLTYFKQENIPQKREDIYVAFPIEIMPTKMSATKEGREFIYRVCLSMGPTFETPKVEFDNYMDIVEEKMIKVYSWNDLVDYLHIMKKAIVDNEEYFYYGQVRDTDTIAEILKTESVNIPTKREILEFKGENNGEREKTNSRPYSKTTSISRCISNNR